MRRRPLAGIALALFLLVTALVAPASALATTVAGGTWSWQNPKLQGNSLREVAYADADNVWAVGEAGTAIHSDDGGATWSARTFGTERPVVDVSFVDHDYGWLIGDSSVYRTTDGGATWIANDAFRQGIHLSAGTFADRKNGWVVGRIDTVPGQRGIILATTDGGVTWREQMTGVGSDFYAVHFISSTDGWVTGASGIALHTLDGGASWTAGNRTPIPPPDVYDVAFGDANHGCTIEGTGTILYTSDGGDTWGRYDPPLPALRVHFNGMDAWAVLIDIDDQSKNVLMHSSDGGKNWHEQGYVPWCWDVAFADGAKGCAVGPGGYTLQTDDGGATWSRRVGAPVDERLYDVTFTDADHGYAVGWKGVLKTEDSGATWAPRNNGVPSDAPLHGVYFADSLHGWAVGWWGSIVRTDDGGTTWTVQPSGTSATLTDVTFSDAANGWAVGEGGTIVHTADGGQHWASQTDTSGMTADLEAVKFLDGALGIAVGSVRSNFPTGPLGVTQGVILRTTDGGKSWKRQSFPRTLAVHDVCFTDANHGFAVATGEVRMMYTADGGASWTIRYPGVPEVGMVGPWWMRHDLYAVDFADTKNGWATGSSGTIVHTTDGGLTWAPQASNTLDTLRALAAPDASHAWTVGEFGTILTAGGAAISPVTTVGKPTASIEGATRIGTAIEAAKAAFPSADTVVIATAWNFPDALGGSSLAGALDAPLLLTDKDSLPAAVADEIKRLGAKDAVILGGTPAVGSGVANQLAALLGGTSHVRRVGGTDRYDTAALVAGETLKALQAKGRAYDGTVFVAVGDNFPDALAASPLAAAKGWPILLTRTDAMPAASVSALGALGATRAVMLGSERVVSASVASQLGSKVGAANVSRLAGNDRYLTALEIADFGKANGMGFTKVAMTTGENYPDALSGGVMAGRFNSVMLLTPKTSLYPEVGTVISSNRAGIEKVYYLGSTSAVSQSVRDAVAVLLK